MVLETILAKQTSHGNYPSYFTKFRMQCLGKWGMEMSGLKWIPNI